MDFILKDKSKYDIFYKAISVALVLYIIILFTSSLIPKYSGLVKFSLLTTFNETGTFIILPILIFISVILLSFFIYKYMLKINRGFIIIIVLFLFALSLRLTLASFTTISPDAVWGGGDFVNYINYSKWFINGEFDRIAVSASAYQLPSFGGLAILNGIIGILFSPSASGFQIANCIMTSVSAILLYQLGSLYNKKVGLISSLLFIIYPANIVMTGIPTNQHGAIMMSLLGFLILIKSTSNSFAWKKIILIICSACSFVISNYFHPSSIINILAILCFTLVLLPTFKKNKQIIISTCCVVISYFILINLFNFTLVKVGFLNDTKEASIKTKIVVGLNSDHYGMWNQGDVDMMFNTDDTDAEVDKAMNDKIIERLSDPKKMINLFIQKGVIVWFSMEDTFGRYVDASIYNPGNYSENDQTYEQSYEKKFENLICFYKYLSYIDKIYLVILLAFACIGLIFRKIKKDIYSYDIFTWCLGGYMFWLMISEICSRYRYYGVIFIILFGAVGIEFINECVLKKEKYIK